MGTRTYSRRAANGSRVPTALGIRTGKFRPVAEEPATLGTPFDVMNQLIESNPLVAKAYDDGPGRVLNQVIGVSEFGLQDELNNPNVSSLNARGLGPYNEDGTAREDTALNNYLNRRNGFANTRMLVEQNTESDRRFVDSALNSFTRLQKEFYGLQADDDVEDYTPLMEDGFSLAQSELSSWGDLPTLRDVRNGAERGSVSARNAERIINAVTTVLGKMPDDTQILPAQRVAVTSLVERLGALAAVRSQIYDASVLNPAEGDNAQGGFTGVMGRRLASAANDVTNAQREILNAVNRVLGQETSPDPRGLPPEGTYGEQLLRSIVYGMGILANNSANKMARDHRDLIMQSRNVIRQFNQSKGVNLDA